MFVSDTRANAIQNKSENWIHRNKALLIHNDAHYPKTINLILILITKAKEP